MDIGEHTTQDITLGTIVALLVLPQHIRGP